MKKQNKDLPTIRRKPKSAVKTKNEALSAAVVAANIAKSAMTPIRRLQGISIQTQDDCNRAGEEMHKLKEWDKLAEDKESTFVVPLKKLISDVKELFSPFRTTVKELIALKKMEILQFAASQKQKQINLESDGRITKLSTLISKQNELEIKNETFSLRKTWTAVPINIDKTPKEYLMPDLAKIKDALKAGKIVAGWEWKQIESVTV